MRFFVTGEQNRQQVLNTIVLMFLIFMVMLWISFALMFFQRMNLTPHSIQEYYLGSPQKFTEPRSYQSLLEVSHAHLFSMGILAVTLTHLLLFAPVSDRIKIFLSFCVYGGAIGDEASSWLVRFVSPNFAYLKISMFLLMEISLLCLILIVTTGLLRQRGRQKGVHARAHRKKRGARSSHPVPPSVIPGSGD